MDRHRYNTLLRMIQAVNAKCDRILRLLNKMRGEEKDNLFDSIRESARDIYQSSLEERRRTGKFFSVHRHD
jgi:hypothetical protein